MIVKAGSFRRRSDSKVIQRFRCLRCRRRYSNATFNPRRNQKKRTKNHLLRDLLSSAVSQRRAAKILNISRTTVARKARFLGLLGRPKLKRQDGEPLVTHVQFDDMETFEHTKLKPLSITLAVEHPSRRILGFAVARMPAKGLLAHHSRQKYGPRPDERPAARAELFEKLREVVAPNALIESDQHPHYPADVKRYFPQATHQTHKGRRGAIVGQGELKKIGRDPLFSLNHTCAMHRAGVSRLLRRTWNTTKKPECLELHLSIYAEYHNSELLKPKRRTT